VYLKSYVRIIAINIVIVLFILVVFEILLRFKRFHFEPYKHYRRFGANIEAEEIQYYEKDSELFWKLKPSQTISTWWVPKARINSLGLRGYELEERSLRKYMLYVLCLGDSGIFGWGVPDNLTLPYCLEAELKKKFALDSIKVINAGVPGYSSYQGVILLKRLLMYIQPKIIIFCFGRNDHNTTVFITDKERKHIPKMAVFLHNILLRTRVYQWIYMKTTIYMYKKNKARFFGGGEERRDTFRVPIDDFREDLLEAVGLADKVGAKLFFIPRAQLEEYTLAMKEIAAEYDFVEYIDLKPYLSDREVLYFSQGEHSGYDKVAKIVSRYIVLEDLM